jgi:hypothetical protein
MDQTAAQNRELAARALLAGNRDAVTVVAETAATAPLLTERFQQTITLTGEAHSTQLCKGTQVPTRST